VEVRLVIELTRSSDGRIEGEVTGGDDRPALAFSGVLELLKVLEDLGPDRGEPRDVPGGTAPETSVDFVAPPASRDGETAV
jgi:hypothetical protein